jgi:hypothetical protein
MHRNLLIAIDYYPYNRLPSAGQLETLSLDAKEKYLDAQTITDTLTRKNQFQAVTGTKDNGNKPSQNYITGPDQNAAANIYGAAVEILNSVPKNYLFFTSNIPEAYGPGTDIGFLDRLKQRPGSQIIGKTVFSISA